jgi:hypothetical protein
MKEYKLITCNIFAHKSIDMIKRLKEEKGIVTANKSSARGTSSVSNFIFKEVEVLSVVVEESRADEIFNFLYEELELDKPHRGMIYQNTLGRSSSYELPNITH